MRLYNHTSGDEVERDIVSEAVERDQIEEVKANGLLMNEGMGNNSIIGCTFDLYRPRDCSLKFCLWAMSLHCLSAFEREMVRLARSMSLTETDNSEYLSLPVSKWLFGLLREERMKASKPLGLPHRKKVDPPLRHALAPCPSILRLSNFLRVTKQRPAPTPHSFSFPISHSLPIVH